MNDSTNKNSLATEEGTFKKATRWLTILILSLLAGFEAGLLMKTLKNSIIKLTNFIFDAYPTKHIILATSILSGISVILFIGLVIYLPKLWRRVLGVSYQRAIIYISIQLFGISLGLIGLNKGFSFWLTFLIVFAGTRISWSRPFPLDSLWNYAPKDSPRANMVRLRSRGEGD